MLTLKKLYVENERDAELQETVTNTMYAVEGTVKLAMDSIWDYTGSDTVNVESIQVRETVYEDDGCTSTMVNVVHDTTWDIYCLLYTSPSPRDLSTSRMPSSA